MQAEPGPKKSKGGRNSTCAMRKHRCRLLCAPSSLGRSPCLLCSALSLLHQPTDDYYFSGHSFQHQTFQRFLTGMYPKNLKNALMNLRSVRCPVMLPEVIVAGNQCTQYVPHNSKGEAISPENIPLASNAILKLCQIALVRGSWCVRRTSLQLDLQDLPERCLW